MTNGLVKKLKIDRFTLPCDASDIETQQGRAFAAFIMTYSFHIDLYPQPNLVANPDQLIIENPK